MFRRGDRQDHQPIRLGEGERSQQQGIDGTENGRVRTYAHGQRQHRHHGEPRGAPERSERESHVAAHVVEDGKPGGASRFFLVVGEVAELAVRNGAGVLVREGTVGGVFLLHALEPEVELDLLLELALVLARVRPHAEPVPQRADDRHGRPMPAGERD